MVFLARTTFHTNLTTIVHEYIFHTLMKESFNIVMSMPSKVNSRLV